MAKKQRKRNHKREYARRKQLQLGIGSPKKANRSLEEKFYLAANRIHTGQIKSAVLKNLGMTKDQFNEFADRWQGIRKKEGGVDAFSPVRQKRKHIAKTGPEATEEFNVRGHFTINPAGVRTWKALKTDGTVVTVEVDQYYSSILGYYWEAVREAIGYRERDDLLLNIKETHIYTMQGERIELLTDPVAVRLAMQKMSPEERTELFTQLYIKDNLSYGGTLHAKVA